jgi:hypothetical protein
MRLHVAHDETGRIVAASRADEHGDRPVERPGVTVTELEVPTDLAGREIHEVIHLIRVDVRSGALVRK